MKSVLVYCGANSGLNPIYKETAVALGKELVKREIRLIYGGGSLGLMGTIADTVMENGGEVVGIIPSFLDKMEVGHPDLTEIHVVETMHERKALMEKMCDGVVTLPGGFGSMDELFEILSWAQLGLHRKPVGLLNVNGFYEPLIAQMDLMVREGFLKQPNREIVKISHSIEGVFELMEAYVPEVTQKWLDRENI
ncbi:LOG family protein [Arcticibacterium luteifluviistationis]|uniref:Cytokinin riboside 5'-monophosphate phosphoribohydrolase n=1 Tax=Arcticibacterium luteifluviistationis TaxID=1784714 RepID=A0A2Z4GEA0_9BACT|nr:TIGR00730 family Rossman fold protein [Arcticibacterium luteifluviistationis]AWV99576.1 TIGR00730 family Rossman fold protein [Arcticibacterium luteifluviistationis]